MSKKEILKIETAKHSKKIMEFFSKTSAAATKVPCEPMEVDDVEIAPDDDMEIDILSWEVRDAIILSRQKAIRLRRARLQRKTLLASIAENLETRNKKTKWAKELLLDLWWKE